VDPPAWPLLCEEVGKLRVKLLAGKVLAFPSIESATPAGE
jgi:hypothetical protein